MIEFQSFHSVRGKVEKAQKRALDLKAVKTTTHKDDKNLFGTMTHQNYHLVNKYMKKAITKKLEAFYSEP